MSQEIYRYTFGPKARMQNVEETLLLAVLAAESLHGQARVRLDASFCLNPEKRTVLIDASSAIGQDLCRIFTGFAIREFGETSFKVRHARKSPAAASHPQSLTT